MEASQIKDRERATWTRVAPGWQKHDAVLTRGAASVSERMLDLARVGRGARVLDIASGTGEPAIPAARRVGPGGSVLGVDFAEEMLTFAREKAAREGLAQVTFRCVDGEELDVPSASFDAVTIRWGLMFMPDPVGCLRRSLRALVPGGRVAASCWAEPERNPFVSIPLAAIRRHVDLPAPAPGTPGIFAFADPARLRGALEQAGFRDVAVEAHSLVFAELDSEEAAFAMMRELAGPVAALLAAQPEDRQATIIEEAIRGYAALRVGGKVALGGVTWIASGTSPGP